MALLQYQGSTPTPQPARLLAVDDDPPVGEFIARVARDMGFESCTLSDPQALTPALLAGFDVVTLDLSMPGRDGIELLRLISGACPQPALVLVSGLDQRMLDSVRQLASARGLQTCQVVRKPFRAHELKGVLGRLHEQRRAMRGVQASHAQGPLFDIGASELDEAITRREFEVHYQPQLSSQEGTLLGVEALARWRHPRHGLLFPRSFISMAEEAHLALPFTEAILESALADYQTLQERIGFEGTLSVNLPPTALFDISIPERILGRLHDLRIPPSRLIIEVTETSLPADLTLSLDILTRLRMRGVRLSIDDFGTGHSGLSRLRDAPFDELKIDMEFVRHAETDPACREIVRNAIRLGHGFNMKVVAEGVESERILHWLRAEGCDLVQGYHLSRPLAVETLITWAQARLAPHHPDPSAPVAPPDFMVTLPADS